MDENELSCVVGKRIVPNSFVLIYIAIYINISYNNVQRMNK